MTLDVLCVILSLLLAQVLEAKVSTMKLKPPTAISKEPFQSTFAAVGGSGTNTTSVQPGALLAADQKRYLDLLDRVSAVRIAPAARSKSKRQLEAPPVSASPSVLSSSGSNQDGDEDVVATNNVVFYSIDIGVGANEDVHELLVDTGSSNTWIGSLTAYQRTNTSVDTGSGFSVTYGSGQVAGEEFEDTVTIGDLRIEGQSIGVALQAVGFETTDGILGIGPTDLTAGTLSNSNDTIPTVVDQLFDQGEIDDPVIGVFFAPSEAVRSNNGLLTFGGMDTSLIKGSVLQVPRTRTAPAAQFWGVDMRFSLGKREFGPKTAGITDTGTTLIMLADDYFQAYASLLAKVGGRIDSDTGLVQLPSNKVDQVPPLHFGIDAGTLSLIGDAQFFPESVNPTLGITGDAGKGFRYSVTASLGSVSGQGLDFIWGMKALERFTTGYNSKTGVITFGQTAFTTTKFDELALAFRNFETTYGEQAAAPSVIGGFSDNDGEVKSAASAIVVPIELMVALVATVLNWSL